MSAAGAHPAVSEEGLRSGPSVAQHFARLVFLVDVREALQRLMVPTVLVAVPARQHRARQRGPVAGHPPLSRA